MSSGCLEVKVSICLYFFCQVLTIDVPPISTELVKRTPYNVREITSRGSVVAPPTEDVVYPAQVPLF